MPLRPPISSRPPTFTRPSTPAPSVSRPTQHTPRTTRDYCICEGDRTPRIGKVETSSVPKDPHNGFPPCTDCKPKK